jgi:hypothetical protein
VLLALTALAFLTASVLGQSDDGKKNHEATKFPAPPKGFDIRRDGIDLAKLATVEYDSTTVGVKRKAQVALPHKSALNKTATKRNTNPH